MSNKHLLKNLRRHNDEYYTRYIDIENELEDYKECFKDKIVYCNCDFEQSNFVKYFQNNFEKLGLKKLNFSSRDFRSDKSIETLIKSDIIVTNPPFSYIRDFVKLLIEYKKKFLFIGSRNLIGLVDIFPYIKNYTFWITKSKRKNSKFFNTISGDEKNIDCYWYTNLGEYPVKSFYYSGKKFKDMEYREYYNCKAIDIESIKEIPDDYYGTMGVPINFLELLNKDQFDLLYSSDTIPRTKIHKSFKKENKIVFLENGKEVWKTHYSKEERIRGNSLRIFNESKTELKKPYKRIFIKRKQLTSHA